MILESLLAFLGLIFGLILAKYTPEEFKSGRKYFVLFSKLLLFVMIVYLLYLVDVNILLIGFVFGVLVGYLFRNIYFYLGVGLFNSLNLYFGLFVFLFGLPFGTLIYHKKFVRARVLSYFIMFFITALILFLELSKTFVLSFVAGALFVFFIRKI